MYIGSIHKKQNICRICIPNEKNIKSDKKNEKNIERIF